MLRSSCFPLSVYGTLRAEAGSDCCCYSAEMQLVMLMQIEVTMVHFLLRAAAAAAAAAASAGPTAAS